MLRNVTLMLRKLNECALRLAIGLSGRHAPCIRCMPDDTGRIHTCIHAVYNQFQEVSQVVTQVSQNVNNCAVECTALTSQLR